MALAIALPADACAAMASPPLHDPMSAPDLANRPPRYPVESRRAAEEGRVLLRVFVDETGNPRKVEVRESSGSARLDEAALAAVRTWRFKPARTAEGPVAAWVVVPISFALERAGRASGANLEILDVVMSRTTRDQLLKRLADDPTFREASANVDHVKHAYTVRLASNTGSPTLENALFGFDAEDRLCMVKLQFSARHYDRLVAQAKARHRLVREHVDPSGSRTAYLVANSYQVAIEQKGGDRPAEVFFMSDEFAGAARAAAMSRSPASSQ